MFTGDQTVRLIERVHLGHGEYTDGDAEQWPGCSVQAWDSRGEPGEVTRSRWRFFAPPGFPRDTPKVIAVDDLRLQIDGELQLRYDLDGVPAYVTGQLKRWKG